MRLLILITFLLCSLSSFSAEIDSRFMTTGFNTLFSGKTTDGLTEGSTNKYYSSTLFNSSFSGKTTDDLTQGSTNKYFSNTLARGAVTATVPLSYNGTTGEFSIQNVDATHDGYLSSTQYNALSALSVTPFKQAITLVSGDITAQYVDLSSECKASSLMLIVKGASAVAESLDYTVSVVSTKTRITFAGDLATGGATPLIAGDKLYAQCIL